MDRVAGRANVAAAHTGITNACLDCLNHGRRWAIHEQFGLVNVAFDRCVRAIVGLDHTQLHPTHRVDRVNAIRTGGDN